MNWRDQRPDDAMVGAFDAYAPPVVTAVAAGPFREAMSRYGAAVHVITTDGPAGKGGFTATAVCSVSDDPPTLLVCVNRKGHGGQIIGDNGVFCVNTLGADSEELSNIFAGRTGRPFCRPLCERHLANVENGGAGARVGDCRLRLPRDRDQRGREPQCHHRSGRSGEPRTRRFRRWSTTGALQDGLTSSVEFQRNRPDFRKMKSSAVTKSSACAEISRAARLIYDTRRPKLMRRFWRVTGLS